MAEPLTVQSIRRVHQRLAAQGQAGMRQTVTAVALAGEKQAKINASSGAHKKGTRTPATRDVTGPAVISGNLRRNITHEPTVQVGTVYTTRIGVARGAGYGKYVESLGYRFMAPTEKFLKTVIIPIAEATLRTTFHR